MKSKAAMILGVVVLIGSMASLGVSVASAQVSTQIITNRFVTPSVGVALTQFMQVNVVNDSAATADARRSALVIQARVVDRNGVEVVGSDRQTLPRGATFSWRIPREALSRIPADELGRVQARVEIMVIGVANSGAFVPSLELVNGTSGVTESGMIGDIRTVISAEAAN